MLHGKNVFITGANRGIGKAILIECAKNRANVWAHSRKETEDFKGIINEISKEFNVEVWPVYFDMTDTEKMKQEIKKIQKTKVNIDVLVNNAGIAHGGLFQMTSIEKIKEVFNINLFSHMKLTQLFLRSMTKNKQGAIINISSISGIDLKEGNSAYGASKAALIAWTKVLSKELSQYNIRVNSIAPGLIDTNMAKLMNDNTRIEMVNSSTMKRLGCTEEIANVVSFLASSKSSFVNGQIIRVDGGQA